MSSTPEPLAGPVAPAPARGALPGEPEAEAPDQDEELAGGTAAAPLQWRTQALLFAGTVVSVFYTGAIYAGALPEDAGVVGSLRALPHGWRFAVPLLSILLFHEFGHYFAARYHRVDASLPYFLPLPKLSPFGTMGAIISMRGRIKTRDALLDIGASGPLAGLLVAIPVLAIGLAHSPVQAVVSPGFQEGQSLLYLGMKRLVLGPIPPGHDVFLNPVAFAGWSGLFVTALNLIPIGQLDGGHIAYALFGKRQDRYARILHRGLLLMFVYNLVVFVAPVVWARAWGGIGQAIGNSIFYLMWFGLLHLMKRVSGRDHPPTEPGPLAPWRRGVALLSLGLFILLFMPTPWSAY
jgi:membrane-associated protease RseP (regulator of RpoE activity)